MVIEKKELNMEKNNIKSIEKKQKYQDFPQLKSRNK